MNTVMLVGRLLVSLAVVLGVLWLIARRAQRRGGRRRQSAIEVLGRQQLGRHSAVAVVRVAGQTLILGVTDGAVSLLTTAETEDEAEPATEARHPAPATGVASVAATNGSLAATGGSVTTSVPARGRTTARPAQDKSALAGSVLSPGTWRQTVDTLRDLTARSG